MPDTPENQDGYSQPVVQRPGIGFPLARVAVLLSLATGACHDLAIAPYAGKGIGETTVLRQMYDSLRLGDVVVADALFDNCFLACELRQCGVELVARVQAERVGTRTVTSGPDGDLIIWRRPNKAHSMKGEQYRTYPKSLLMRQVSVDARGKDNRVEQFKVVTTLLDLSAGGGQIGELYERTWQGRSVGERRKGVSCHMKVGSSDWSGGATRPIGRFCGIPDAVPAPSSVYPVGAGNNE